MRHKKYGYGSDTKGSGGNVYSGWRTVRAGGVIRFDGFEFQSDLLIEHRGERVFCTISGEFDIWYAPKIEVENSRLGVACYAVNTKEDSASAKAGR